MWYEQVAKDPENFQHATEETVNSFYKEAENFYNSEVMSQRKSKTDPNFNRTRAILAKGTTKDKIAVNIIQIQDNPVYSLDGLKNLVKMVQGGKKHDCVYVVENLNELFLKSLLREGAKLKRFSSRPLNDLQSLSSGNINTKKKLLTYYYFEDQLKEVFANYVQALNNLAHDSVDANKEKAVSAMFKLLLNNPEQEKNLLQNLINKFGDPSPKIASKTMYYLMQLLKKHSNMQSVILTEVEKLLFRSNISTRAQYYCLCFLSQFYLSHDYQEVARRLIEIYFAFFKACIKKGEIDSKMMSALLTGVYRAYPYAKLKPEKISQHINTMYKIVHLANFTVSMHALALLFQVSDYAENVSDRFYSALYRKLYDRRILCTSHQAMLLNLIYRALLKDENIGRVKTFIKRLLQLAMYLQTNVSCGVLILVSQIICKKGVMALKFLSKEENESKQSNGCEEEPLKNEEQKNHKNKTDTFDPLARNPAFAGGQHSVYTELLNLKAHYHPTVKLFTEQILNGQKITYTGDPLKDFTLLRFLDRFVFKNPKKKEEPQAIMNTFNKRKLYAPSGAKSLPVTSLSYLTRKVEKIPADELFLYNYLQKKRSEKEEGRDDSDAESVDDEEFEKMFCKISEDKEVDEDLNFMEAAEEGFKLKKKKKGGKKNDEELAGDEYEGESVDEEELDETKEDFDEDLKEDNFGDDDFSNDDLEEDDLSEDDLGDDNLDDDEDLVLDDLNDLHNNSESQILSKSNRKKISKLSEFMNASDFELSDSEGEEIPKKKLKSAVKKGDGGKVKRKKINEGDSPFASAEEFAMALEDEGGSSFTPGKSTNFVNKDKSDAKQIKWEEKRNFKLLGKRGKIFDSEKFKGKKRVNVKEKKGFGKRQFSLQKGKKELNTHKKKKNFNT